MGQKGVDKAIVDSQLEELRKSYSEAEVVKRIAKDKLDRLKGLEPGRARARVYGYLSRRGFSPEIISDCLSQSTHES